MPELPEVETVRRGLEPLVEGQRIKDVRVFNPSLRWPVARERLSMLRFSTVTKLTRRAKYLIFETTDESETSAAFLIHLGMSGCLRIVPDGAARGRHDHVDIAFESGSMLRFNDPRRFGAVLVTDDWANHALIQHLGPEPLTDAFGAEDFAVSVRKKSSPIKSIVMDNRVVVGVGNIYANEALFQAGILPGRAGNRISTLRLKTLAAEIKKVLAKAVEAGGTTLKDFADAEGKPGYFQQQLSVYGRAGQPCLTCGSEIRQRRLAQRSTYYCPMCQR